MKKPLIVIITLIIMGLFFACTKTTIDPTPSPPLVIKPVDITTDGFDFLEKMQGHWVGKNRVIADDYDWFAFDYRAISAAHIHGIFEGGSMGNLFTSFFVTDFKNTRTIMARNGGLLNGIYRTSYFVMDSVREDSDGSKYYRLVDAIGGDRLMYMELKFKQDSLYFNSYTSRLGLMELPTRHMTFKGKKRNLDLSQTAATTLNFPQNIVEHDFSNGFVQSNLYVNAGDTAPKSASFLNQGNADLLTLAAGSGDPYIISDYPHLGYLEVDLVKNSAIDSVPIFLYLSKTALTDPLGYLQMNAFDDVLLFPELIATQHQFTFTYLHPGNYYVTAIADKNQDGYPSAGDITHPSQSITITPQGQHQININNITVQN
ncbi:hypothetical protein [Aureispira anguillae]|uniref:Uncharacterized protein n=1 Tax=Aureispira anguillae TaxID=2864201 RepID=A0A916DX22_9BACT|nr:hypothetical protein [Aureispira anguillae]BDS15310.1 hypothetical protein AsAng_0060940 [Aureispira anguillae]